MPVECSSYVFREPPLCLSNLAATHPHNYLYTHPACQLRVPGITSAPIKSGRYVFTNHFYARRVSQLRVSRRTSMSTDSLSDMCKTGLGGCVSNSICGCDSYENYIGLVL